MDELEVCGRGNRQQSVRRGEQSVRGNLRSTLCKGWEHMRGTL